MKSYSTFSSNHPEKLKLLLAVAAEMGIETEPHTQQLSEPLERYKATTSSANTAFLARASSHSKIDILKKVAAEMGITLLPLSDEQAEDTLLAQESMRQEWLAPENNHWDNFLRTHKID